MKNESSKYQTVKEKYTKICSGLFSDLIVKFPEYKENTKEIENLYFNIQNFVKAMDTLHASKATSSIKDIDIKTLQAASHEMINIAEHIRELNPDRETNFIQYDAAKILLIEHVEDLKNVTAQFYDEQDKQRTAINKPDSYVTRVLEAEGFKCKKPLPSATLH